MPDREKVVERLEKVSYYFKSLLAVGWQGDADIYREHRESVNMAIALLKEQLEIVRCKDCKYCESPNAERDWCKKGHLHGNAQTWFCADGKRAEV